jgi:serine/threonine-protein kinase HipA
MDAQGNWRLAPAYDLTFSAGPGGEHYLSVEQEGRNPSRRHVESLGKRHGQSARQINAIIDEVRAALADWPRHAADTGVSASLQTITLSLAEMDRAFA